MAAPTSSSPETGAVIAFLRRHNLRLAESALLAEIAANSLPAPVKVSAGSGVVGADSTTDSSSSGDDDEFVSLGSDLINPYGAWSTSSRVESTASSSLGGSDFGTARGYNDSYWYNEKGGFPANPCGVDKFVTSVDVEDLYDRPIEVFLASGGFDYVKDSKYTDADPALCDCCREQKSFCSFESTSHGIVDEVENDLCEVLSRKESTMHYSHQSSSAKKQVFVPLVSELELQVFESFSEDGISHINSEFSNLHINVPSTYAGDEGKFGIQLHNVNHNTAYVDNDLADKGITIESEISGFKEDNLEQETPSELQFFEAFEEEFEIFDLRVIHRKNRTGFEENKEIPIVLNTVLAGRYHLTEYLGSAAFSQVVQAHDLLTGIDVCLKIIKNDKDFFDQSLDEIKLLKFVNKNDPADEHHILRLYDYFYHREHLFIVCELLRANLYEFQKYNHDSGSELYFTLPRLQRIARQCLEALEYMHKLGVIHCDLKPENIVIKSYSRCEIKIIDLGSSCFQSDNLCLYVQSRSYRAPEVILGLQYDQKIDIWSLGCILAELWSGEVLFPNESLVIILARMISFLGPIDREMLINGNDSQKYFTSNYDLFLKTEVTDELEYIVPESTSLAHHLKISDSGFLDFLSYLLQTNPLNRPTASEALRHSWLWHPY